MIIEELIDNKGYSYKHLNTIIKNDLTYTLNHILESKFLCEIH